MIRKLMLLNIVVLGLLTTGCQAEGEPNKNAKAVVEVPAGMKTAVVGAGCFWCVEVFFEKQEGVYEVFSGYAGGTEIDPSYKEVAYGKTSHAEVVQVIYDPEKISYRELIDFFWTTHDVTRDDGVWPDFGPHYRSILLYGNAEELIAIEASKRAYEAANSLKIATDIKPLDVFYPAENYHQDYAVKNPSDRYVRGVLNPKLKKLGLD
ncbi:MAG: peptide-methionine (S)-S-oxide reductase MsrA [Verrucomicrobiota bacterium]